MNELMTTEEVAVVLKIEVTEIEKLLHSGRRQGFGLLGSWRIRQEDLASFIEKSIRETELQTLEAVLQDPRHWPSVLSELPDLKQRLSKSDFEEGTLGAFLTEAWETADSRMKARNVVYIDPKGFGRE